MKNKLSNKKAFIVIVSIILILIFLGMILYNKISGGNASSEPTFLYLQTAHSGTLSQEQSDGTRILTLYDVSPVTVYFAEKPDRDAGHELTEEFISQWDGEENSFAISPPNAALDIISENSQSLVIVELMDARYNPETRVLEYDAIILYDEIDGDLPESFDEVALFIDSAWKNYYCDCEPSSGEKTCKCKYKYHLGKSATKEFRGYCQEDITYPVELTVGGRKDATTCTVRIFEGPYAARSCTNWNPTAGDDVNVWVECKKY